MRLAHPWPATLSAYLVAALAIGSLACGSKPDESLPILTSSEAPAPFDPGTAYQPLVRASELSFEINNPLFLAPVGARWIYEAHTDEGLERIEVSVLPETLSVWGATVRAVRDTGYLDGVLEEDTRDLRAAIPRGSGARQRRGVEIVARS